MSFAIAVFGALVLIVVPGALLAWSLGLRNLWLIGMAAPLSLALLGISAVVAAWVGVSFAFWQPTVLAALLAVVAYLVRRSLLPRSLWHDFGPADHGCVPALLAVVIGSAIIMTIFAMTVGDPAHVSQSYDGVFHLNAVAWILETGDASSFDLYRMTHPGDDIEFYPAAWHGLVASIVQLTGAAMQAPVIPVATNAAWLVTTCTVWLPGIALFTRFVLGRGRGLSSEVVAVLLGAVATAVPWALLGWGTLYPMGLATVLLPSGLAIVSVLLTRRDAARFVPLASLGALWLAATAFAHPRSLVSFVLLALPLSCAAYILWARRQVRMPRGPRRVAVVTTVLVASALAAVGAGVVYVYRNFDVATRPISDHLNGGPATATETLWSALLHAMGLALPPPDGVGEAQPQLALALAVAGGVVLALRSRRLRWLAIAWIAVVLVYTAAAGSNSDLAKVLTGVWYKDKYRLFVLLGVVGIPLAALAVRQLGSWIHRRGSLALTAAITACLAALSLALGFSPLAGSIGRAFTPTDGGFISPSDYRLMGRLPQLVPAGETIAGNPWDGSTLTWAIGSRRSLFPHLVGEWTADEITVAQRLDTALEDPAVCDALERLGVHYVFHSPGLLWGEPQEAQFYAGIDRAVEAAGVLEPVAREGDSVLLRIVGCGHESASR